MAGAVQAQFSAPAGHCVHGKRNPTMRNLTRVLALVLAPVLFGAAQPAHAGFARAELEQMLAPIALYPDSVLSHILIAATYPDQVEEAARWSRRHPDLSGEAAVDAVERHDWDPSVKALAAFPDILARMDEDPDWTEDLGDAFLDQEADVMDSVQVLRERAHAAGRLDSLEYVRVIREREYIYIEPAVRHVVYIPYYDPWYVYGTWWWPSHPPYCWRSWRGHPVSYYPRGFHWGIGFHLQPTFYFTSFHWSARHVVVTQPRPNWRPLYSGRDVAARQPDVRHWREERSPAARAERRESAPQARRGERGRQEPRSEQRTEQRTAQKTEQKLERRPRTEQRREDIRSRPERPAEARNDRSARRSELRAEDVERRLGRRSERGTEQAALRPERQDDRGRGEVRERGAQEPPQQRPSRPVAATERREAAERRDDPSASRGSAPEARPQRSQPEERTAEAPGRAPQASTRQEGRERSAERRERGNGESSARGASRTQRER
jgi:hypothetical protein